MKRRLTIARSLINDPELLLLDEPTTGLDPQARHVVWDRLFRLKQRGVTLVLTTHYMDEAEQLCDRLVVMDHGRIVAEGSPRQLIEEYSTREVVEVRFEDERPENGALRGSGRARRGAARPRPHLHGRRRRDGGRRGRSRPAAALDPRAPQLARGRLPAPDRAHADRVIDGLVQPLRAYEHWLAQYKRVWRGTIGTSLLNPLLYLAALGRRARHDRRPARRTRRPACPTSTSSRPACSRPRRCRPRRSRRAGRSWARSSGRARTTR